VLDTPVENDAPPAADPAIAASEDGSTDGAAAVADGATADGSTADGATATAAAAVVAGGDDDDGQQLPRHGVRPPTPPPKPKPT